MFPAGYTHQNSLPKRSVSSRTISDYSPFGVLLPERSVNAGDFRYGFNGMEGDRELKGLGNSYTTEFRQYDPRLGRWHCVDPLADKYASWSPFNFCMNNPILFVDYDGREVKPMSKEAFEIIKLGLTEKEAEYVQLNAEGFIDKDLMQKGLQSLESAGGNFMALAELVSNVAIIEFYLKDNIEYIDFNNVYNQQCLGAFELISEMDVMWELNKESWESQGKTKEDFIEKKKGLYSTTPSYEPIGESNIVGLTSHPVFREDGKGIGKSTNENHQVTIDSLAPQELQVSTAAHELYGHMLFNLLGKPDGHGSSKVIGVEGANDELESQINERESEAVTNYRARF